MQDENGNPVTVAGPSKPVVILGWSHVPSAGDDFREVEDEREARHLAEEREAKSRQAELVVARRATLQDLLRRTGADAITDLNLIVKADVQGSVQALEDSLLKLPQDEVRVNIVRAGAGGITENDVTLAMASDAIIVGFNVRPSAGSRELAEKEGVDIRTYRVIYDAIDDIKSALSGLLKPEERERVLGEAEVRQTFRGPDRRELRDGRHDPAQRSGAARPRRRRRLRRQGDVAAAVQGRRLGGARRLRVRHRPGELPRHQGRRRDRGLRGRRGRSLHLTSCWWPSSGSTCGSPSRIP
jgi:translation initiation factor IF-2